MIYTKLKASQSLVVLIFIYILYTFQKLVQNCQHAMKFNTYFPPQPQRPLTNPVIPPPSFLGDFLDVPAFSSISSMGYEMWLPAKSKNNGLQGIGL